MCSFVERAGGIVRAVQAVERLARASCRKLGHACDIDDKNWWCCDMNEIMESLLQNRECKELSFIAGEQILGFPALNLIKWLVHEAKLELEDLHTSTPMELECRLRAWVGREPSVEQQRRSQRIHDRVCSSNKMTCHIAKPLVKPDSSLFTRYHFWGQAV